MLRPNLKSGKQLLLFGFGALVLTWALVAGNAIDNSLVIVIVHLLLVGLIALGLIMFFLREFSLKSKSSIALATAAVSVVVGCIFYVYLLITVH